MKKLNKSTLIKIKNSLENTARPLEIELFKTIINGNAPIKYLEELSKFQNTDGGFGQAIEPDLRVDSSCSMSTSVGIRYALKFKDHPTSIEMIKKSIQFLENTYDNNRKGWFAVGKEVNNSPHAPWWHWNEETKMTAIDEHWGNPSAELLGYLLLFEDLVKNLDLNQIKTKAYNNLIQTNEFKSFHELFCYAYLIEANKSDYAESDLIEANKSDSA